MPDELVAFFMAQLLRLPLPVDAAATAMAAAPGFISLATHAFAMPRRAFCHERQ